MTFTWHSERHLSSRIT